ncbi:dienelactone hydrolase family protein [Natronomonas salina]|uniref:dienelactone hydrolase family protein n=1 Tax=Natronomonas salina TaxID=1710540 RepID=UPI0015B4A29B|nr:dienelactone hydrolase family protein [Natronomonas salina]QLD90472.1 dienelactone hydrolase family protein [Natronomonas salina]
MTDSEEVVVPSDRDVRATVDGPDADACVVACPPHPQMGGSRTDARLRAVGEALDCACLRFDYGDWDGGPGELADARDAYAWAREEFDEVGLFGYSFGGCLALVVAARESAADRAPFAAAALSPADRITDDIDAVAAVGDIDCPVGVVYGERDTTVDAEAVAERVRETGGTVEVVSADHHFVGQTQKVAEKIAAMLSV